MAKKTNQLVPNARTEKLLVRELSDEVVVYDLERDKAICLNSTVAAVWKHCGKNNTASDIAQLLEKELETPIDERVVWLAISQLEKFHLLQKPAITSNWAAPQLSRRDLMRMGVATAVALPLIVAISAPTAAQAASAITSLDCGNRHNSDPGGCGGTPCSDVASTFCKRLGSSNNCGCRP
jgi:hypothetical protein